MTGNSRAKAAYQEAQTETSLYAGNAEEATLVVLGELIKSMRMFAENADPRGSKPEIRTHHFSRALTIIYALQSGLDLDKGGALAGKLFQIYEYARQALIKDLRSGRDDTVSSACGALDEVLVSWQTAYSEGLDT
jgi:flagellar protein FliS